MVDEYFQMLGSFFLHIETERELLTFWPSIALHTFLFHPRATSFVV